MRVVGVDVENGAVVDLSADFTADVDSGRGEQRLGRDDAIAIDQLKGGDQV